MEFVEKQFYTHNESLSPYYYKQGVLENAWEKRHNKFISHFQESARDYFYLEMV